MRQCIFICLFLHRDMWEGDCSSKMSNHFTHFAHTLFKAWDNVLFPNPRLSFLTTFSLTSAFMKLFLPEFLMFIRRWNYRWTSLTSEDNWLHWIAFRGIRVKENCLLRFTVVHSVVLVCHIKSHLIHFLVCGYNVRTRKIVWGVWILLWSTS